MAMECHLEARCGLGGGEKAKQTASHEESRYQAVLRPIGHPSSALMRFANPGRRACDEGGPLDEGVQKDSSTGWRSQREKRQQEDVMIAGC